MIDEFEGGADFDSLIEKYNADPGMQNEPTATKGYAVSANSTTWDPAFTEGAMSIAEVGQISAPVYGQNGIHVIYYLSDITPGPVALRGHRRRREGCCPAGQDLRDLRQPDQRLDRGGQAGLPRGSVLIIGQLGRFR